MLFVSQAPLEKLQTYKRRMGWSFPWVSSANTEFNLDLGYSSSEEQTLSASTPIVAARWATGARRPPSSSARPASATALDTCSLTQLAVA